MAGLIVLLPLLFLLAIWVKVDSQGPVFFRQVRVGRFGEPFKIHKFRTMRCNTEPGSLLTVGKDSRVTFSGRFLRKYKLDEIPQLIDVVMGNMSLVGPRPEVPELLAYYDEDVRTKILSVRPGITDRASIQMIDENDILAEFSDPEAGYVESILPIKQRFYLNYVENNSLKDDIVIIALTIRKIILRK